MGASPMHGLTDKRMGEAPMPQYVMTFEPLIPAPAFVALLIGAAGLLAWYALRRPAEVTRAKWFSIVGLMSLGLSLVLLMLLNPTRTKELPGPSGKPLLTILVDDSCSMATPDVAGGRTRFESAARIAAELAQKLNE